ncbi:hypothetical protein BGZ54_000242 [Gamsiella multidivaricata]|nr:hypothetical protein BGZ54_000242 [Gamsiella multidivaricata]
MPDLSLFCLIDGEPTSNAFLVSIPSTDTIGHLKKLIKAKKTVAFADVAADKLTLWRVSVTITDDDEEIPILLDNVEKNDKKKLGPATRLHKVFPEDLPEETIHIIVQRPPLGISELNILSRVPPGVKYVLLAGEVPSKTTTGSPFSQIPTEVVEWDGFLEEVASYTPSNNRTFEERRFQFTEHCLISDEGTLCTALESNVYRLLNWLTLDGHFGAAAAIKMIAQPDRIFYQHP